MVARSGCQVVKNLSLNQGIAGSSRARVTVKFPQLAQLMAGSKIIKISCKLSSQSS